MKSTENYVDFATAIEKYFRKYLAAEMCVSKHTVRSYRDTFVLLLEFFQKEVGISCESLSFDMLDRDAICKFLDWLEEEKKSSVTTRNQRCAALKSFFSYMEYLDPAHLAQWSAIRGIKQKKCSSGSMNYLSIEGIRCIFEQIDLTEPHGLRNLTMLSLLYNTGARVQELIDLKVRDLRLDKPYTVELFGKGRKKRVVPIDENMQKLLKKYLDAYGITDCKEYPVFFNARHAHLSPPGVGYVITKYADLAREKESSLIPDKISPHCFRHSKAMHLLQAGCPLIYIRDLLGHVSVRTTEVYAKSDSKQKREVLESAYSKVGLTPPNEMPSWEKDSKLKEYLKSLGKK